MLKTVRTVMIIVMLPIIVTAISLWAVPILWTQGSSAAFNFAFLLCITTVLSWVFAFWVLMGWYKEIKSK